MKKFNFLLDNAEGETGIFTVSFNAKNEKEAVDTVFFAYGDDVKILECTCTNLTPNENYEEI
jgi:hypothetical protein